MKIFVTDTGDAGAGIGLVGITLEVPDCCFEDVDEETRNNFRKELANFLTGWLDLIPPVNVHFENECATCHERFLNGRCNNKNCIESEEFHKGED